jgi:hypothetical protein
MAFEWHRMHKWEENIEREVTEGVEEQIMEHYGVDDIVELTKEQIAEVIAFREEYVSEYSPMNWGFGNVINRWEEENYEENK